MPLDRSRIERSIPTAFAAVVSEHPDRVAIADLGQEISYRDLDERSNRIANAIANAVGYSPAPVGILLGQGHETIAAILGVLKAGKFYVPMEPADGADSLRRIFRDCDPQLIVTTAAHAELATRIAGDTGRVLDIRTTEGCSTQRIAQETTSADSLAYIYYTSGSTGPPKGVYDCHRNVLHNAMRYSNNLGIGPDDRHSLIQSPSFSGVVSTIFCTLLEGGTLCPFDLRRRGIGGMAEWLNAEKITVFHSVPAIFDGLLSTDARFPAVRLVRLEGDRSYPRHVQQFQERFEAGCLLANGLGCTETGLIRQLKLGTGPPFRESVVPVGYAIEDMHVSVVDDNGIEVPHGEIGRIAVRSRYLAFGYWQQPELTAQAFPGGEDAGGSRVFRSSDLGCLRADGCLEFHGRIDTLRKIRGRSIDLNEIETALSGLPAVEQALAMIREDTPGDQQLVAYFLAASGERPDPGSLRRALAGTLERPAIPSQYVCLDRFPTTDNGKIDRGQLPAPSPQPLHAADSEAAPATARQNAIADCFSEVLGIDEVGLHDSFLDLGGDSLKATELLLSFTEVLGIAYSPDLLAADDTVAAIDRNLANRSAHERYVQMQAGGNGVPVFFIHGPRGHVLSYRHLARLLSSDRAVFGVPYSSPEPGAGGADCLEDLARRHVRAIRQARPEGPYIVAGECFGGLAAFEIARQLHSEGDYVASAVLIDTRFPERFVKQVAGRMLRAINWMRGSESSATEKLRFLLRRCKGLGLWLWHEFELRRIITDDESSAGTGVQAGDEVDAVVDELRSMEHRYRPRPCPGEVVLVCPENPHNQLGWKRVSESLRIIEVPTADGDSYDTHLTEPPAVSGLGRLLRERFRRLDVEAGLADGADAETPRCVDAPAPH